MQFNVTFWTVSEVHLLKKSQILLKKNKLHNVVKYKVLVLEKWGWKRTLAHSFWLCLSPPTPTSSAYSMNALEALFILYTQTCITFRGNFSLQFVHSNRYVYFSLHPFSRVPSHRKTYQNLSDKCETKYLVSLRWPNFSPCKCHTSCYGRCKRVPIDEKVWI